MKTVHQCSTMLFVREFEQHTLIKDEICVIKSASKSTCLKMNKKLFLNISYLYFVLMLVLKADLHFVSFN